MKIMIVLRVRLQWCGDKFEKWIIYKIKDASHQEMDECENGPRLMELKENYGVPG